MKKIDKKKLYMILGITILCISIIGSAYAYYSASASKEISGTAGGGNLTLNVELLSTSASGTLVPLDNNIEMLTKAALGNGNDTNTYDSTKSCIDKNGRTACQIYKVTIGNTSSVPITLNGGVSLSGENTPNIECAVMDTSISVTDNTSCKGKKTLANKYTLNAGSTKDYYIMIYIKNIDGAQTDSGDFNGTITFTSIDGKQLKARFKEENIIDENAAEYITSLYTNADKSTVENNSITYNYAPSVHLMNDRLGGVTEDLDGGNIRYYGITGIQNVVTSDIEAWQSEDSQNAAQELLGRDFTSEDDCKSAISNYYSCTNYSEFDYSTQEECEEWWNQNIDEITVEIENMQYVNCSQEITETRTIKAWQSNYSQAEAQSYIGREFTSEADCLKSIPRFYDCSKNYGKLGFSSLTECEEKIESMGEKLDTEIETNRNHICSQQVTETMGPNNYIYFNCSDYNNQTNDSCELWRIIGVFDGKLKIIRNRMIGTYSWDTSDSTINDGWGINEWSQADLMKLLNPGYESEEVGGSLYYNSSSGTCYVSWKNKTDSCDFISNGIKNDATRNKIATVTWNTGGLNSNTYSNLAYKQERGTKVVSNPSDGITRQTVWTGKIALAYPSDYGYATDFTNCSKTLLYYDSSDDSYACRTNDWMYQVLDSGWFLTTLSNSEFFGYAISYGGVGYSEFDDFVIFSPVGVAPTLFLNANEVIYSGLGTSEEPYQLS